MWTWTTFLELVTDASTKWMANAWSLFDTPIGMVIFFAIWFVALMIIAPLFIKILKWANKAMKGGWRRR